MDIVENSRISKRDLYYAEYDKLSDKIKRIILEQLFFSRPNDKLPSSSNIEFKKPEYNFYAKSLLPVKEIEIHCDGLIFYVAKNVS